jgi:UPF0716 protein FxsA
MRFVLLFFVILSAMEISIFILLGNIFDVWFVLFGIIFTGIIGAYFAKQQGIEALRRAKFQMQNGQFPHDEILDGISILIGGILLVTPGFVTDTIGFLFLIPFTRTFFNQFIRRILEKLFNSNRLIYFSNWRS